MRRLLSLDYVLEHPGLPWLPTESEKVGAFKALGAAQGVNADKLSDELFLARDWENECRLRERVVQKHGSVAIDTGRD